MAAILQDLIIKTSKICFYSQNNCSLQLRLLNFHCFYGIFDVSTGNKYYSFDDNFKKMLTDKKIELFNVIDSYIMDFRTIQAYT